MSKNGVRNPVHIDESDARSILKFRMGFPFGEKSAWFCKSMWLLGSMLNFCVESASSIGGFESMIAANLFPATVSDSKRGRRMGEDGGMQAASERNSNISTGLPDYFCGKNITGTNDFAEAVLQGVPFTGVQVVRWKRPILLHKNGSGEPQK